MYILVLIEPCVSYFLRYFEEDLGVPNYSGISMINIRRPSQPAPKFIRAQGCRAKRRGQGLKGGFNVVRKARFPVQCATDVTTGSCKMELNYITHVRMSRLMQF
ncbi:hypothetical protein RND81_11G206000 [Saponaria officinalis]|uniref:Uncharacterized protein n=1 Tax=Saponaria officinalis TaxID=3572 RepID=A0AAW1HPU0_SAPOF